MIVFAIVFPVPESRNSTRVPESVTVTVILAVTLFNKDTLVILLIAIVAVPSANAVTVQLSFLLSITFMTLSLSLSKYNRSFIGWAASL